MRIVVTGGSGKAGRAVVRDLLEHGHEVLNVDLVASAESSSPDSPAPFLRADLTDFGQALEALGGGELMAQPEAVVHLTAIPSPVHATPDTVFRTNMTSTHAVFAAAVRLGHGRVVWASSETTLGLPSLCWCSNAQGRHGRPRTTRQRVTRLVDRPREVQSNRRKALFPGPSSMELGGLEPPTSWVRSRRSPN